MTTPAPADTAPADIAPPDDWTEILVTRDVDLTALSARLNEAYGNPSGLQINVSTDTTLPATPDNPASLFVGAPGRVFPPAEIRAHLDATPIPPSNDVPRPARGPARVHREDSDPRGPAGGGGGGGNAPADGGAGGGGNAPAPAPADGGGNAPAPAPAGGGGGGNGPAPRAASDQPAE